jgi:predicted TIM-barrel fold metal-dependent hydrolase
LRRQKYAEHGISIAVLNDVQPRAGASAALRWRIVDFAPVEDPLMARQYNVIDADGHILEPLDLWDKYMDPKFRDRAPRLVIDNETGKEKLSVEGQLLGSKQGMGGIGGVGARQGEVKAAEMKYNEGRPGGFDPHKRIPDMDLDGIDAAFLYPSMGLFAGAVHDPALAGALCRAYNRWLADYCKPYPDRLFGVAMLPMQSVEHAIQEMKFARKELGFKAAFIRPNPYNNKMINHPDYEPFWAAAEEVDMAIGFHEGGSSGMPTVGIDRFEGRAAQHIISHTMEMMLACLAVIWGGVCEKHPKVRIGFLESGGGWIAPWLDRMDRHFDDQGFNDSGLQTRPSELFKRNCWISFEPVEGSLNVLADYIGPNKIMWATDYPHRDGFFPGAPDMVRERLKGTSPATQHGVLAGGAMGFYGLN